MHIEFETARSTFGSASPYLLSNVKSAIESWCDSRELSYGIVDRETGFLGVTLQLYFHDPRDLTLFVLGFHKYPFCVCI